MSLRAQLSRLEGDGLIQVAATYPELEYLFRHGLIKDAAYYSLLKGHRRTLHQAVGETLEQLAAGQTVRRELLPALAHHFSEAGDAAQALHYATLAADAAAAAYANAEAILHYTHALAWSAHTPITADQLMHLYLSCGRAQEMSGDYATALATYTALEAAARARAEPPLELASLIQRVVIHAVPSGSFNADEALRLANQADVLAQQLGDRAAEARLAWARMLAYGATGHHALAAASGEIAVGLARALDQPDLLAVALMDRSRLYMAAGELDRVAPGLAEARGLWRALNNVPMLAESFTIAGGLAFFQGRYPEALAHLQAGLRLSQSIANAWGAAYNLMLHSYVLFDQGHLSAAVEAMHGCLVSAAEGGFIYPQAGIRAALGVAYTYLGQDVAAGAALHQALQAAEQYLPTEVAAVHLMAAWASVLEQDYPRAAGQMQQAHATFIRQDRVSINPLIIALIEAELDVHTGRPAQALERLAPSLRDRQPNGIQAFVPDLLRLRGEALLALGRAAEAEQALLVAHAQAAAQPSYRTLWTISAALARLAAQRADTAGAAHWRAEAHRHRDYLAEHITDLAQRAAFLARADARAPTAP